MARPYSGMALADPLARYEQGVEFAQRKRMREMALGQQEATMQQQGRVNAMLGQMGSVQPEQRQQFLGNLASQGKEGLSSAMHIHEMWGRMDDQQRQSMQSKLQENARMLAGVKDQDSYNQVRDYALKINPQLADEMPEEYDPNVVNAFVNRFRDLESILGSGAGMPASVRETQWYLGQTGEVQSAHMGLKRAAQTMNLGGSQVVLDPTGGIRESYDVTLKPSETAQHAADVEGSKVRARADTEREINAPKAKAKLEASMRSADTVMGHVDSALERVSGLTAGQVGSIAAAVRGTPAYDLRQSIITIKANLGFDRLQEMRDNSPTGGALGQVAVQELEALQATVANLDLGQSPETLKENLALVKEHYENYKNAVQAAYEDQYLRQRQTSESEPQPNGALRPGHVEDGWRFIGGDPASPNSWERI